MEIYANSKALGMVETYGYIAHIVAADACLKAANVKLIGSERVKGGYMLVKITGDVGAVKAAIDVSKGLMNKLGYDVITHVIPRPSTEVEKLIYLLGCSFDDSVNKREENKNNYLINEQVENKEQFDYITEEFVRVEYQDLDRDKLLKMNVAKLRSIARTLENISINKNQINYGKKEELIIAILECLEGRE